MTERTFSILKPDATRRNLTGAINAVIEGAGLRIVALDHGVDGAGQVAARGVGREDRERAFGHGSDFLLGD